MKLLFDENISDRIVPKILNLFPGSTHVKSQNLIRTDDDIIWSFAKEHGFTIISKDADFHQRSIVFGHPPKLIFLRVGNCSTNYIAELLRSNLAVISEFDLDAGASLLILK